ncbi:unnamed protein product [Ectocarpus sp. 13 AM-2016]
MRFLSACSTMLVAVGCLLLPTPTAARRGGNAAVIEDLMSRTWLPASSPTPTTTARWRKIRCPERSNMLQDARRLLLHPPKGAKRRVDKAFITRDNLKKEIAGCLLVKKDRARGVPAPITIRGNTLEWRTIRRPQRSTMLADARRLLLQPLIDATRRTQDDRKAIGIAGPADSLLVKEGLGRRTTWPATIPVVPRRWRFRTIVFGRLGIFLMVGLASLLLVLVVRCRQRVPLSGILPVQPQRTRTSAAVPDVSSTSPPVPSREVSARPCRGQRRHQSAFGYGGRALQLKTALGNAILKNQQLEARLQAFERAQNMVPDEAGAAEAATAAALLQKLVQGVTGAAPVDLGTAFARGQLQDACAKAVFAQRALDPEHGLLEVGPQLGAGGHGSVSRARDPTTGVLYAVKTALSDASKVCLRQEARNIIRLGPHHAIVGVKAIVDKGESIAIAMELGEMDLLNALSDNIHTPAELLRFAAQMMDGIHFMHSKGIVHGDVKLSNVLLVKEGGHHTVGKLADLGLARAEGQLKFNSCGTLGTSLTPNSYYASVPADKADDIWALGVMLLSLLSSRSRFSHNHLISLDLLTDADRAAFERCTRGELRRDVEYAISFRTANDSSFQQRIVKGEFLTKIEPCMRARVCRLLRRMVDPHPRKRPDIGYVRRWLPSIIGSAERHRADETVAFMNTMPPLTPPRSSEVATMAGSDNLTPPGYSGAGSSLASSSGSWPSAGEVPSVEGAGDPAEAYKPSGGNSGVHAAMVPSPPSSPAGSVLSTGGAAESGSIDAPLEGEDRVAGGQREDGIPNQAAAAAAIEAANAAVAAAVAAWSEGSSVSDIDVAGPGSGADIFQALEGGV